MIRTLEEVFSDLEASIEVVSLHDPSNSNDLLLSGDQLSPTKSRNKNSKGNNYGRYKVYENINRRHPEVEISQSDSWQITTSSCVWISMKSNGKVVPSVKLQGLLALRAPKVNKYVIIY